MSRKAEELPTSAYEYALPPGLIAHYPAAHRDESRLLLVRRDTGAIEHLVFRDLRELIPAGDALVLNETRVFPARLLGKRASGAEAEILLLNPVPGGLPETLGPGPGPGPEKNSQKNQLNKSYQRTGPEPGPGPGPISQPDLIWVALVRPGSKLRPGRVIEISSELSVEILESLPDGSRIVRLETELPIDVALEKYGRVPLPPYIERDAEPEDTERYQTVYARERGSVAAPTAGLHFTPELLEGFTRKGVQLVRLVLHVGVGTFRPVEVEDPASHVMHDEQYVLTEAAADALNGVRATGGAIWAVGTTVTRTLETVADEQRRFHAGAGRTNIYIRPPYRFRAIDRLITNFHLPRSTLLMLVSAFGGYDLIMRAYGEAVSREYRFYSYGDAMVVL